MQKKLNDLPTPQDYVLAGYEVKPASNGGFVIFYGATGPGYSPATFAAVSDERDLLRFLANAHGVEGY